MVAVKEVEGGQRDTFVISDVPCMSSALRCSQYFLYIYICCASWYDFYLGWYTDWHLVVWMYLSNAKAFRCRSCCWNIFPTRLD